MKSVKPGRGPSLMGAFAAMIVAVFGFFWTFLCLKMLPPEFRFMCVFGVLFVIMAIAIAVYNFKNAKNPNRYSAFDIVDDGEEPDSLQIRFGKTTKKTPGRHTGFCPYCGGAVDRAFGFCPHCGKPLPDDMKK